VSGARRERINSTVLEATRIAPNTLEEKQCLRLQYASLDARDKADVRFSVWKTLLDRFESRAAV
jgi:hypothetical protein